MKEWFKFFCDNCGRSFDIDKELMLCPYCKEKEIEGKPLKGVLKVKIPDIYKNSKRLFSAFDTYDYLPAQRNSFPRIPIGKTPLIQAENIQREIGIDYLYLKLEGFNPTGSLKDRASILVSAFAKQNKINNIVVASTGNAASSMAGIGAAAGQRIFIFMPETAPKSKLIQCLQYGATLIPIKGNYDVTFDLSLTFSNIKGYLNRNTAFNPFTIEGKKTVSFEIVSQLADENIDYVFVPVGDGVILSGVIKGFLDLKFLGVINKIPKIIGVQSEQSKFIFNAFKNNSYDLNYKADTVADSISVNIARNAYTAVFDLKKVNGDMLIVPDEEILKAQKYLSKKTGIFCEPASAATLAGLLKMKNGINRRSRVVLILTGNGLKDIDGAARGVTFPDSFEPDMNYILNKLK